MAQYAIIQNGTVVNLVDYDEPPQTPIAGFPDDAIAVLSSNAGPGWTYNNNIFTAPQPFPSWSLVNNEWTPPVAYPTDGNFYMWNEQQKTWVKISTS